MTIEIASIEALYRYPVKSMRGERLETATLGWHGIEGDRRLALRRVGDGSDFPWLNASKLPELLLFTPHGSHDDAPDAIATHVRPPAGAELPVLGEVLAAEIGRRHGAAVQMMALKHGVFDDASISVIATDTVSEIARLAAVPADARRFRPNVLVRLTRPEPFGEDDWLGGVLTFGESDDAPAVAVTQRDIRCTMVSLDPDTAATEPQVLKTIVREHQNTAGIYGTVTRTGRLAVGQRVYLER